MARPDSLTINISMVYINRLADIILDVSNAFHNRNVIIYEIVCIITPPYYIDIFERFHPIITLNGDDSPFCNKFMNIIQGKNQPDANGINCLMQGLHF